MKKFTLIDNIKHFISEHTFNSSFDINPEDQNNNTTGFKTLLVILAVIILTSFVAARVLSNYSFDEENQNNPYMNPANSTQTIIAR